MAVTALDDDFNPVEGPETVCLTGNDETAQNIVNFLCLRPGESCLYPGEGIDWLAEPYRSAPNQRTRRKIIQQIEKVGGVDRVLSIEYVGVAGVDGRYCANVRLIDRSSANIEVKPNVINQ